MNQEIQEEEEWRIIEDYPNYSVSSFGNVKNNKTGLMMKLNNKLGYINVGLTKNKKKKTLQVHRLVALTFIENPENKPQVNHKDKDATNNNITNLEWNTSKENCIHRSKNLKIISDINKGKNGRKV